MILAQTTHVKEIINEEQHSLSGTFHLGVLPTIAPYLLPRFSPQLMEKISRNGYPRYGNENNGYSKIFIK